MKRKDFTDLKTKSVSDLKKIVFDKKAEEMKARMSVGTGKEKNLKKAGNLRREIAKIQTLVREKEILAKLEVETEKGKENA